MRRRWRLAHWQRRSDHLIVPGTSLGRRGRSKRAHYVDRLGAVGHWAWSERQHLFTGVRQPLVTAGLVDRSHHLEVKCMVQVSVLALLHRHQGLVTLALGSL